jgi:ribosomal protein S18 acetylase RimI-like enzyme
MQIRALSGQETDTAVKFLQAMVNEMATFGGHPARGSKQISSWFRDHVRSHMESQDHLFLIAELTMPSRHMVGILEASIAGLHPVFKPRTSLHVHSIYVAPKHRRSGVARKLVEEAFAWGRKKGCVEADLNVLKHSPAKELYEDLGFRVFQTELRREL